MNQSSWVSELSNVVGIITAPVALYFVIRLVNKIDRLAKEIREVALYNARNSVHCVDIHKDISTHLDLHDGQIKEIGTDIDDHEGRIVKIETIIKEK